MNYCRCSICNRTNNHEVTLLRSEFTRGPFFPDKRDPTKLICFDCRKDIQETLEAFYENVSNPETEIEYLDFVFNKGTSNEPAFDD